MIVHDSGEWWVVVGVGGKGLMILVFKLHKQYMIGLTQDPFNTNDEGGTD